MTLVRRSIPYRMISGVATAGAFVVVVAVIIGQVAVAEVIGGGLLLSASMVTCSILTSRAAIETDPGRVLIFDLLLMLVVVLGLTGVAVMGLAIL